MNERSNNSFINLFVSYRISLFPRCSPSAPLTTVSRVRMRPRIWLSLNQPQLYLLLASVYTFLLWVALLFGEIASFAIR